MYLQERQKKFQQQIITLGIDAFLVSDSINLFYLTGLQLSAGNLIVTTNSMLLCVDGRYIDSCRQSTKIPVELQGTQTLAEIIQKHFPEVKSVGISDTETSYRGVLDLQKEFGQILALENPLKKIRMIKDDIEINLLQQAADLGSRGYDHVLSIMNEGVSEEELAIELEIFWKRAGGEKVAFSPIIAFGPNSALPHYRAGNARLKKGDLVLIDIGVTLNNYHSDMTRVFFFGDVDPELAAIYEIVKQAQTSAIAHCKPGVTAGELDDIARTVITEAGYGPRFLHSLGHGIGLEVHEAPILRNKKPQGDVRLEANMVVTIEPGIYLEGKGGVRIEDTIRLTEYGCYSLTQRPI